MQVSRTQSQLTQGDELEEPVRGWVYKGTKNSDLVVHRRVELFRQGKLITYHDFETDKKNCKRWYLDSKCELVPKTAAEICVPESKLVRGRGTWTITATVRGEGQSVKLYLFTINWPSIWAPKGYSALTIGCEDLAAARTWHQLAEQTIACMKARRQQRRNRGGPGGLSYADSMGMGSMHSPMSKVSFDGGNLGAPLEANDGPYSPSSATARATVPPFLSASSEGGALVSSSSQRPVSVTTSHSLRAASCAGLNSARGLRPALDDAAAAASDSPLDGSSSGHRLSAPQASPPAGAAGAFAFAGAVAAVAAGAAPVLLLSPPASAPSSSLEALARGRDELSALAQAQGSNSDSSDDDGDGFQDLPGSTQGGNKNWLGGGSERWVPYKQTNGIAIYHLDDPSSGSCASEGTGFLGGEYLVSTGVRGSPAAVLDVLMHGSSNTTILGPASKVELLECTKSDDTSREIMRLILEAPGWVGRLCAPREMLVERMLKTEEGMHVVLFSSVDPGMDGEMCSLPTTQHAPEPSPPQPTPERRLRSLYSSPVLGEVQGTYTIAPLEGHSLETSPEALITCIIKVDLKGVCGDRSWMRPVSDALGWTDAFLDRILMTVILVRDQVEHSRFVLKPLTQLARNTSVLGGRTARTSARNPPPQRRVSSSAGGALASGHASADALAAAPAGGAGSAAEPGSVSSDAPNMARHSLRYMIGRISRVEPPGGAGAGTGAGSDAAPNSFIKGSTQNFRSSESGQQQQGVAAADLDLDLDEIRALATLEQRFWQEIHAPGKACPFLVRGPTYLKDRKKIPAGLTAFTLAAMDVVTMPHPVQHVARYLPSIRMGRAPFAFIINLIIPGTPLLGIVTTFITDRHPDTLGTPPNDPMEDDHGWDPFDFVLYKFIHGDDATRNLMLKLIPHIADGSWVIKQSVGTTPVITGKALKTTYHLTKQYMEVDIDVSANNVAAYVTGLVRGATKSLVIDMGFVLEGTKPWELPECLLGAMRLPHLDLRFAHPLDISQEIELKPPAFVREGTLHRRVRPATCP